MSNSIVKHDYNGFAIPQRSGDGYVSLTAMADVEDNKTVAGYLRLKSTTAYLEGLAADMSINTTALIQVLQGGNGEQGTWAHPEVAIDFAKWVSVSFRIWANREIKKIISAAVEKSDPTESIAPIDPLAYVDGAVKLEELPNSMLKSLIHDAMVDRLELARNNSALYLTAEKKRYTITKVRAVELGYSNSQIGNGATLGAFVKRRVTPDHKAAIGRYKVWHYEVTPDFDNAIHAYFSQGVA